jgi:hypothetical protein
MEFSFRITVTDTSAHISSEIFHALNVSNTCCSKMKTFFYQNILFFQILDSSDR